MKRRFLLDEDCDEALWTLQVSTTRRVKIAKQKSTFESKYKILKYVSNVILIVLQN